MKNKKIIHRVIIYNKNIKRVFRTNSDWEQLISSQKSLAEEAFDDTEYSRDERYSFEFSGGKYDENFIGYAVRYGQYYALNCTAHQLQESQILELQKGWSELPIRDLDSSLKNKLLNCPDNRAQLEVLASELSAIIADDEVVRVVLPIGSPAFNFILSYKLHKNGAYKKVYFSHSERESIETAQPDGSVIKKTVFNHKKFISFD